MTSGSRKSRKGKSPSLRKKSISKDGTLVQDSLHSVVTGPRSKDPLNPKLDATAMGEIMNREAADE